jgi:biotin synthase
VLLRVPILFFAGDKLLTTPNSDVNEDMKMFEMLGLNPQNHLRKFHNLKQ